MSHFLAERELANVRTTCYLKGVSGLQHMQGAANYPAKRPQSLHGILSRVEC
jgi:hypothetical protein